MQSERLQFYLLINEYCIATPGNRETALQCNLQLQGNRPVCNSIRAAARKFGALQ
jgi:hypothetical protein